MREIEQAQVRELLSWRLAAALLQALPVGAALGESHPGGGLYDCLDVRLAGGAAVSLNRPGSVHVFEASGRSTPALTFDDLEHGLPLADAVARVLKLLGSAGSPAPAPAGPAPARAVGVAAMAALLSQLTGSVPGLWEYRLASEVDGDTDRRRSWLAALDVGRLGWRNGLWVLLNDGEPRAVVDPAAGLLAGGEGEPVLLETERLNQLFLLAGGSPVLSKASGSPAELAAERRQRFREKIAPGLAGQLGVEPVPMDVGMRVSATVVLYGDDERLLLAVDAGESDDDVDRALAWGLAFQQDRDLLLVLPDGRAGATLDRLAWIGTPVRVYCYGPDGFPRPAVVPARAEVLARRRGLPMRPRPDHELGDRAADVGPLLAFADAHWALTPQHRGGYLSWHCRGRQVLKLSRSRAGVRVEGGVQYRKPTAQQPVPLRLQVVGPISAEQRAAVEAAVAVAVRDRVAGADAGHREHELQSLLADAGPSALGLSGPLRREFPAWRGEGQQGFLDFLSHDGRALHVVETKLGNDARLVLQALDYWMWVRAHSPELAEEFGVPGVGDRLPVIDLVVAEPRPGEPALGPYTLPQLEALDGEVPWRVHVAVQRGADVLVHSAAYRRMPDPALSGRTLELPRHATRSQRRLLAQVGRPVDGSPMLESAERNLLPSARPALADLVAAGADHRYLAHVRSSQAFAVNCFAPLEGAAVAVLLRELGLPAVSADRPVFEWRDPVDRLGEATGSRPHATQVDVVLRGRDEVGTRLLALVEVKLSEIDFGHCSAFEAEGNDRRDVCRAAGAFGSDRADCFQLRNWDRGQRRRYDTALDLESVPLPAGIGDPGGCTVRLGLNQPMRNVALARLLAAEEAGARVVFALCAPSDHATIWRRWGEVEAAFGAQPDVALRRLPAEMVAQVHPDGRLLAERYLEQL